MRSGLPALALALAVAAHGARADDEPPEAPASAGDPCPSAEGDPCPSTGAQPEPGPATDAQPEPSSPPPQQDGWVDASHGGMERGINALVLRLDRFFGDTAHEP